MDNLNNLQTIALHKEWIENIVQTSKVITLRKVEA